jgi:4-hydroxy-2-oxoheptanedioate aldolase
MRASRVLKKLREGEVVSCFKTNLADSRAVEIPAMQGFDCVWTCMEHVANDWSVIEKQIMAAKVYNVDTMVRVSRGGYSDYTRPLELDAAGIMVPHIMSLDDAKNVVKMTRFHPIGRRPVDGGNADGAYCNEEFQDYLRLANEQRFICIQIEDPEPLADLEKIAKLDGIDMLFFGPADFSQGIGAPGQWDHPKIAETRKRIAEVSRANGKFAGTVGSPENFAELAAMGYQFINLGADVVGLNQYCKQIIEATSKTKKAEAKSIYGK